MDNCTIHHVPEIRKSIEALLIFLPPYSPDFAPIEETFSKTKKLLESVEEDMPHISNIETLRLLLKIVKAGYFTVEFIDKITIINLYTQNNYTAQLSARFVY